MKARTMILKVAQKFTNHKWLQQGINKGLDIHPSYIARIIGDCCPNPIYNAWYRIYCTSDDFKEFGQPYYRDHPNEAANIKLN